jgi:hypothetical protein
MDVIQLSLWKKVFYVIKNLYNHIIRPALTQNPNTIRERIYRHYKENKIDPEVNKLKISKEKNGSSYEYMNTNEQKKLADYALYFWFLGDLYWSKNDFVAGYKSAWFYVLAAEASLHSGHFSEAGKLYHFAGHQFKRINSLQKAMIYYFESAKVIFSHFGSSSDSNESLLTIGKRSICRAISISKEIGDEEALNHLINGSNVKELNKFEIKGH